MLSVGTQRTLARVSSASATQTLACAAATISGRASQSREAVARLIGKPKVGRLERRGLQLERFIERMRGARTLRRTRQGGRQVRAGLARIAFRGRRRRWRGRSRADGARWGYRACSGRLRRLARRLGVTLGRLKMRDQQSRHNHCELAESFHRTFLFTSTLRTSRDARPIRWNRTCLLSTSDGGIVHSENSNFEGFRFILMTRNSLEFGSSCPTHIADQSLISGLAGAVDSVIAPRHPSWKRWV